jgi:hypothetical protein
MQSRLIYRGRPMLEVELPTTGIDREEAARVALITHGFKPGSVIVEFLNPSTTEVRE